MLKLQKVPHALLLSGEAHPESEVDKVTTPRGCTISGLKSDGT